MTAPVLFQSISRLMIERATAGLLARRYIVWQLHALIISPSCAVGYVEKVSHLRPLLGSLCPAFYRRSKPRVRSCLFNVQRFEQLQGAMLDLRMPIHRLLETAAFEPEHIAAMVSAYDRAARELTLADGERRASNEVIATTVIEITQTGERDASILAEKTIARLHR